LGEGTLGVPKSISCASIRVFGFRVLLESFFSKIAVLDEAFFFLGDFI